jgi:signal transduction histidine kinase
VRLTVRRRAVIAALLAFPVGWLYVDNGWRLFAGIVIRARGSEAQGVVCSGAGLPNVVGQFNGCNSYSYRYGYAIVELIIGTVIAVAIVYALARWVTWPLRSMTEAVEQLGPNNLGLRMRQVGPRGDETRRLGDSIDRMLDRVAEGYEAQRRFASNASHELRTPLATQRALIEVSLGTALTAEQLDLVSRQLLATNERNERLVDGLLTLAETDRGLVTRAAQRLDAVVADVVETLRASAAAREVTIAAELAPVTVAGETPLLERLATNLVQNAIKYNVPGGRVQVEVGPPGTLTVRNTGPQVPAEAVDSLFEPFRRLSGERLDHGGGVGLGLTIARSIVAAHGGSIEARPNPDGGLSVTVHL